MNFGGFGGAVVSGAAAGVVAGLILQGFSWVRDWLKRRRECKRQIGSIRTHVAFWFSVIRYGEPDEHADVGKPVWRQFLHERFFLLGFESLLNHDAQYIPPREKAELHKRVAEVRYAQANPPSAEDIARAPEGLSEYEESYKDFADIEELNLPEEIPNVHQQIAEESL